MKCKELMPEQVYQCGESDPVERCAQVMRERNIGLLPIVNSRDKVVGVLTDRDICLRVVAAGKSPSAPAREVMTLAPLITCRPDDELRTVEARMGREKKSRVLVLDEQQRCIGVISLSDIARAEEQARTGQLLHDVAGREAPPVLHS